MTLRPSRDEFRALAREHTVIPVWREVLADFTTPVAAFARLVGDEPGFLLESVEHGERWSRWSFIGRNPLATLTARGRQVETTGHAAGRRAARPGHPRRHRAPARRCGRRPTLDDLPPLHGGIMGYLGYDVVREVEHLPDVPARRPGPPRRHGVRHRPAGRLRPLAPAGHPDRERARRARASPTSELDRRYDAALVRLDELAADGARPLDEPLLDPPDPDDPLPDVRSVMGADSYRQAVEVAKEHILAGDVFQVVLAQRFDLDLEAHPFDVYRVLRQVNPSPYMYFVRQPGVTLVGSSPEPMVQLLDGTVISRPIAGTRRRGRTDEEDRRMGGRAQGAPQGDRRARHAHRPGPQRRRAGSSSSAPSRSTR